MEAVDSENTGTLTDGNDKKAARQGELLGRTKHWLLSVLILSAQTSACTEVFEVLYDWKMIYVRPILSHVIPHIRRLVWSEIEKKPSDRSEPLSSKCDGRCGLSAAALQLALMKRKVGSVPHQLNKLLGVNNHFFLFIPIRDQSTGGVEKGLYVDLTWKQFNWRDTLAKSQELRKEVEALPGGKVPKEYEQNVARLAKMMKRSPVAQLVDHQNPKVRSFALAVLKKGYAEVDNEILREYSKAMSTSDKTGEHQEHTPITVERLLTPSTTLLGANGQFEPSEITERLRGFQIPEQP